MGEFNINKYKFSSSPALSLVGDEVIESRAKEIILLSKDLNKKGIIIKDLIIKNPSLKVRNKLLNIAKYVLEDEELLNNFKNLDKFPVDDIVINLRLNRSLVEQWQDYLVTYIYLLSNPKYKSISDYLRIEENLDAKEVKEIKEIREIKEIVEDSDEVSYVLANPNSGIVVAKNNKAAIIITSQGEFKRVKLGERCKLGEEVSGKEKKSLRKHKFEILILSALALSLICITVYKYVASATTVIIDTTSQIIIEVNSYDKIIEIKSPTEKGKKMIEEVPILDVHIDEGLVKIFEYVKVNEMIPSDKLIITIVGEKLPYATLLNTKKYLDTNYIKYKINNNGIEAGGN